MSEESVLSIRDFRKALAARLCDALGSQMLGVVVGWQIYKMTGSALALGLIGLAEGLPFMACALWAGHAVDRLEKKRVIAAAEAGILAGGAGLLALSALPRPPLLLFYFFLAWGGLSRSFLFPAQSAYIQLLIPKGIYPKAAAWTTGVLHFATIAGPALGGLLYDLGGPRPAYACVAAFFCASFVLATRLSPMAPHSSVQARRGLEDFLSGARFVLSQRVMLAAMSLDMFGVLFGGVEGILPMFAVALGVASAPRGSGFSRRRLRRARS
jgi:MFS family permease